jgi:hypothetical protein
LKPNDCIIIYRNTLNESSGQTGWRAVPAADASGISQRPEEIGFYDIDGFYFQVYQLGYYFL